MHGNINWLVTNEPNVRIAENLSTVYTNNHLSVYSDKTDFFQNPAQNMIILIDGFIIPREKYFHQYSDLGQYDLIVKLHTKYGEKFIDYIKGSFNILLVFQNEILIYNDRQSIKKFFIHKEGPVFMLSNQMEILAENTNFKINKFAIAIYTLLQHFTDGLTMFENIKYSLPASKYLITEKDISNTTYWDPSQLIDLKREKIDFNHFSEYFRIIIRHYISYLNPKQISMTLTGGRDTRTILAALLKDNFKPRLFTFGYPSGSDAFRAFDFVKV